MKKRINSGTLILKKLSKKELTRTEIRQIAFDNKTNRSLYKKDVKKVPHGWFGNGVGDLIDNGMINYNKDSNNYIISELGKLNINTPYTKYPIMTKKMYTKKINNLKEQLHEYWNKSWRLERNNSELIKENETLKDENEILKSELDKYKKTEEIEFLNRLVDNADNLGIDSYGENLLNRVKNRLNNNGDENGL